MTPRIDVFHGRAAALIAQQGEDLGDLPGHQERILRLRTITPCLGIYDALGGRLLVMDGDAIVVIAQMALLDQQAPLTAEDTLPMREYTVTDEGSMRPASKLDAEDQS